MPILKSMARVIRVLLPVSVSVLAAGCSADVARFDVSSSAGFSDNQTNSIPIPPATVYSPAPRAGLLGEGEGATHQPPMADAGPRSGDTRVAELPPVNNDRYNQPRSYDRGYQAPPPRSYDRSAEQGYNNVSSKPYDAAPRARQRPDMAANAQGGGETIEVKPGDTLYSLSRKHGVKVDDLAAANDLKSRSLKPGQRLTLPSGHSPNSAPVQTAAASPPPSIPAAAPAAAEAPPAGGATADAAGSYTMKPGESLYTVARQHKVNYAELQRANNITDDNVRKIRPGTVLKIPAATNMPGTKASTTLSLSATGTHLPVPSEAPAAASAQASEPMKSDAPKTEATASADAPKVLNQATSTPAPGGAGSESASIAAPPAPEPEKKVAALDTKTATDASPESKPGDDKGSSSGRLRWPVQGRVISNFGPRPDGTHNDGVNFSVPQGTEVHAAESGEVIYVGDELKAYGKLVLLRHDNGWVTAYAHNEDLLVTRGMKVARGDVIAKAGKTGPVDQPQVHFELRQDSKAVDPTSFMERL